MKVHDVMTTTVFTVSPMSSFSEIWKILFQNKVNALPIVTQKKKLVGIITKDDLLKKLYPEYSEIFEDFTAASDFDAMEETVGQMVESVAREFMNPRVIFTRKDTPAMRALSRMIAQRVNQLPVLDETDTLVGMVTKGDVFYALFKKHLKTVKPKQAIATM